MSHWDLPPATSTMAFTLKGMRIDCFFLYDGRPLVEETSALRQLGGRDAVTALCAQSSDAAAVAATLERVEFRHGSSRLAGFDPAALARVARGFAAIRDERRGFVRAVDAANGASMLEAFAAAVPTLREMVRLAA